MLNIDPAKLLVIFVLVLIVMGPDKLPKYAGEMARLWRTFTNFREQAEAEIRKIVPDLDLPRIPKSPSAAASGFVSDLMRPTTKSSAEAIDSKIDEDTFLVRRNDSAQSGSTFGHSEVAVENPQEDKVALDDASMN